MKKKPTRAFGVGRITALVSLLMGSLLLSSTAAYAVADDKFPPQEELKALFVSKMQEQRDNFVEFVAGGKNFTHSKGPGFARHWKVNWAAQQKWCGEIVEAVAHRRAEMKAPQAVHAINTRVVDWATDDSLSAHLRQQYAEGPIQQIDYVAEAEIRLPAPDSVSWNIREGNDKYVQVLGWLTGTPPYDGIFPKYEYGIRTLRDREYWTVAGLPQDPTQQGLVDIELKSDFSNVGILPWGDEGPAVTDDFSHVALVVYRGEPLFIEYGIYPKGWQADVKSKKQRARERWGRGGQGYALVNGLNKNLFTSDWVLSRPLYPLHRGARPSSGATEADEVFGIKAIPVPLSSSDFLYACIVNFDIVRK